VPLLPRRPERRFLRFVGCFLDWWHALPSRHPARRGLMELSDSQLAEIGVFKMSRGQKGMHFLEEDGMR